jgi:pimeloyl-ACP methyl ester carboxylesterase
VETADVLILISSTTADRDNGKHGDLLTYARGMSRPVIRIDAETGTVDGDAPQQIEIDQGWLPQLFEMAGLSPEADLETIKSKMSALANRSAPVTRSQWNWIVFLQGLAVCVPLGWLQGWPVFLVGVAAFLTTLLLWILHWWLRGRSMQKTWAQARLVAETARSLIAASRYPEASPWRTLATVPSLRRLRWAKRPVAVEQTFQDWIANYITQRIGTQKKYFTDKRNEAEGQRKKLTSWTTLLLDVSLFFASVGLILVFIPPAEEWMVGGAFAESFLGSLSILMLLGLLLIQIVRELHELNRRSARFAQQEIVLENARTRLSQVQSPELALEIVSDTEGKLLAEVLEWYFHAETAERFVEVRKSGRRSLPQRFLKDRRPATRFVQAIPGKAGSVGLFVLRAIVTRVPLIVGSAAVVVVWILLHLPQQGSDYNKLERAVHLHNGYDNPDRDGKPSFDPTPEQAKRGIVVMVHGLYGRGFLTGDIKKDERNWMKPCADAMRERLNDNELAICLVDWSEAALPWQFYNLGLGERNILGDLPAIRGQAYVVGDIVAFKLAGIIVKNKLNSQSIPFHLIGHSAGGFVVARLARRLTDLGLVSKDDPDMLHVTILDTPEPDAPVLEEVPKPWQTDFYLTSYSVFSYPFRKVLELEKKKSSDTEKPDKAELRVIQLRPDLLDNVSDKKTETPGAWLLMSRRIPFIKNFERFWLAHRAACSWFKRTIESPETEPRGEGFNDSPLLLPQTQAVSGR